MPWSGKFKKKLAGILKKNDLTYLGPTYVTKEDVHFIFHMFYYFIEEKIDVVLSHEHLEHQWVTPLEARGMDLIPGGVEALEIYCRRRAKLFNSERDED